MLSKFNQHDSVPLHCIDVWMLVLRQNCPFVPIVADQKYTGVDTNVFLFVFVFILFLFVLFFALLHCMRVCESPHAYTYPLYKFIHVLALLPSLT